MVMIMLMTMMIKVVMVVAVLVAAVVMIALKLKIIYIFMTIKNMLQKLFYSEVHLNSQALICRNQKLSGWIDSNPKTCEHWLF